MKKKLPIVIIVMLLCVAAIGVYRAFDCIFPKAEPISPPISENVVSFSLVRNDDTTASAEIVKLEDLLKNITAAKPTRMMSVNDYPTAKIYYTLELHTSERFYRYFIYAENSQIYIEIPYEGIYKANRQTLDLISSYFHE